MSRSFWPVCKPAGLRMITLLAVAGCAALSLASQAAPAAAASAAAHIAAAGPRHPAASAPRPARANAHAAVRKSRHSFAVPGGPIIVASNPRTKTLYVLTLGRTIALVSTARCNRFVRSGCRVRAWTPGPAGLQDVIVDRFTDTIYALFGGTTGKGHTLEVINGARCNVANHSDCRAVARISVGRFPIGETLDRSANTIYVSNNYSNTVSLVSTTRCNGTHTSGCRQHPRAVRVGPGPNLSDLVRSRHTLYVPDGGPGGSDGNTGDGGTTVSLINTATCNAHRHGGCHSPAPTATVGTTPFGVTAANGTVYAWTEDGATMINAATCNAVRRASCHRAKPSVTIGVNPGPGDFNRRTHTVYTVDTGDDTLSVFNTRTCNSRRQSGCKPVAPTLTTGGGPADVLSDPATGTLYVANLVDNTVSVFNGKACDATHRAGCRRLAPSVPQAEFLLSLDPATNTIYGGNNTQPRIDVFDGATCRAGHLGGCKPVASIPTPDPFANVGAIDRATHTLYASDEAKAGTVMVINTAACNARHTSGCSAKPHSIKIGGAFPNAPVLNPATKTLYVSYGMTGNHIAVINAATCNAKNTGGCGQKPAVINVQNGTFNLGVSVTTNTIYGTNTFGKNTDTVTVINGARCNGTNHAGCGHIAAIAKVGTFPEGIAVNDRNHTVYVANNGNSDVPGTVSVLNGATCNGTHTAGCHRRFPTVATSTGPIMVAVDARTGNVYVTTFAGASVTIISGSRCNASAPGCRHATRSQPVGSQPVGVLTNPHTRTVYVTQVFQAGSMSIFSARGR